MWCVWFCFLHWPFFPCLVFLFILLLSFFAAFFSSFFLLLFCHTHTHIHIYSSFLFFRTFFKRSAQFVQFVCSFIYCCWASFDIQTTILFFVFYLFSNLLLFYQSIVLPLHRAWFLSYAHEKIYVQRKIGERLRGKKKEKTDNNNTKNDHIQVCE